MSIAISATSKLIKGSLGIRGFANSAIHLASQKLDINGKEFEVDPDWTNVTPSILNLTSRSLYLKDNHPIGILRDMIETKMNMIDNSYSVNNNFKPAVSTFENFDSLGFPLNHPGRSKSDTYYINKDFLLRTHTSAHEMDCFMKLKNDISNKYKGFLISADVYRRDEIDRTHYPVFHQMEGARLWKRDLVNQASDSKEPSHIVQLRKDIERLEQQLAKEETTVVVEDDTSLEGNPKQDYMTDLEVDLCQQHLKRSIELIVAEVFNKKIQSMKMSQVKPEKIPSELKVRWIKAYFPWTAPSWEIEVWWQGDWLEICGCGLIRQDVLIKSGYEKNSTIGWAFGLGLDRIAMLLFEVPDIRLFWTLDERFHKQFQKNQINPFSPYSKYPGTVRDVAFWLPNDSSTIEVHENDIMEIVRDVAGDLVESVKLIDEFKNPKSGKTSQCYRINYQSMDRNITNEEINQLQERVRDQLVTKHNIELR